MYVDRRRNSHQRPMGRPALLSGHYPTMQTIMQAKAQGAVAKALEPCRLAQLVELGYVEIKNGRAIATGTGTRWFASQEQ